MNYSDNEAVRPSGVGNRTWYPRSPPLYIDKSSMAVALWELAQQNIACDCNQLLFAEDHRDGGRRTLQANLLRRGI